MAFLKGKPDQFTRLCKTFPWPTEPYTTRPLCLSNFLSYLLARYAQSSSHIRFICISGPLHMLFAHALWNIVIHFLSLHTVTTSKQAGLWALGASENLPEASLQREPDSS